MRGLKFVKKVTEKKIIIKIIIPRKIRGQHTPFAENLMIIKHSSPIG